MNHLIQALQDPALYDHPTERFEVIETHISWVLLTGPYAYKIKKPVDLGFLDFTTLQARHFYCQEELRLNRRLAPQLYLDVIPITGTPEAPVLNGTNTPFEFAVKMIEFPQTARLDRVLERGKLTSQHIDQLARSLAQFHGGTAIAEQDSPFGTPERIHHPVQECFDQMRVLLSDQAHLQKLQDLDTWCQQKWNRLREKFIARKKDGFIRECHGDVHLANMVLDEDQVILFDCIEFSENLRWIDVISEMAFATMDLDDREVPALASRLLNRYLEETGDYEGLSLLRYFQVYRALVRTKVAAIQLNQRGNNQQGQQLTKELNKYLALAVRYTKAHRPRLLITHGPSGTGKTQLTDSLLEHYGAIRLRTDVERKRRFGLQATQRSDIGLKAKMYHKSVTEQIYQDLAFMADTLLSAGYSVIVDGTFLQRKQRRIFRDLAARRTIPFNILNLVASPSKLRERITARHRDGGDASEADLNVLEMQLKSQQPLDRTEQQDMLTIDADAPIGIDQVIKQIQ